MTPELLELSRQLAVFFFFFFFLRSSPASLGIQGTSVKSLKEGLRRQLLLSNKAIGEPANYLNFLESKKVESADGLSSLSSVSEGPSDKNQARLLQREALDSLKVYSISFAHSLLHEFYARILSKSTPYLSTSKIG
ncbi:hypothetical protein Mp_zg00500 [Marchantia polymorpha subsp. ruderalis]|uniref:Uncharacterized protein n=2 Tax=Marchantia polymorpha TaxID=3197 RepID=A0A679DXU6_MARPO|nr:hypothetical protein MARPO_0008s0271 [Marchantia polymorpha]BBN20719.1 hypothetical protein Mp_zg00500 [Marchantia polymorpha subsp. ruderalis]|eukprot:PTQ47530.1 hypothetical protein MARPO_0008s0271 [Marchantia polymorpha]